MKGLVFDIKRFAVHDGSGIRTTVFLKGCPLRCVWCHNPEGLEKKPQLVFDKKKCKHFYNCLNSSDQAFIRVGKEVKINNYFSKDSQKIINSCPSKAIKMDANYMSTKEVIAEVLKDQVFYLENGGVTFSGGEPTMQYDFLLSLLKEAKKNKLNTCIETSAYLQKEKFLELLKYLDQAYIDLKIFDSKTHKKYTGVGNEIIKENIKLALKSDLKDRIIIRTPLIPNITANQKNISEITSFLKTIYPKTKYELLNFNPLAKNKYLLANKEYYFQKNPKKLTDKEMDKFLVIARMNLVNAF